MKPLCLRGAVAMRSAACEGRVGLMASVSPQAWGYCGFVRHFEGKEGWCAQSSNWDAKTGHGSSHSRKSCSWEEEKRHWKV